MKLRIALLAAICISSCASAYAQDTSADLQINGTVNNTESACALSLSSSALALKAVNVSALPAQGGDSVDVSHTDSLGIRMVGDKCKTTGLKFIGNTDKTEGNTLLNSLTADTSAKGVGVGVYNAYGHAIDFSQTLAPSWTVFNGNYAIYMRLVKLTGETPTMGDVQSSLTFQLENL